MDQINSMNLFDKCKTIGIPDDAANFIVEYLSEYEPFINDQLYYDMTFDTCAVFTEDDWKNELDYLGVSEEEYEEERGSVWRDSSFNGVLVMGS